MEKKVGVALGESHTHFAFESVVTVLSSTIPFREPTSGRQEAIPVLNEDE